MAGVVGPRRCSVPISGAKLLKTGQTTIYATGDDGDIQAGRDVDFFTLAVNNPFGNTNRFTDELGGSTYTNNIVIDWSTYDGVEVLGYYRIISAGNINWSTAISSALALNIGGFVGWRNVNVYEIMNIMNYEVSTHRLNYAPFNTITTFHSIWTSTSTTNGANALYATTSSGIIGALVKGAAGAKFFAVRTFTVTGTTIL